MMKRKLSLKVQILLFKKLSPKVKNLNKSLKKFRNHLLLTYQMIKQRWREEKNRGNYLQSEKNKQQRGRKVHKN